MNYKILIISISFLLSACTAPQVIDSVKENNWQSLGQFDGENGFAQRTPEQLDKLSKKYGDGDTNNDTYKLYYEKALKEYCQPNNAYMLGVLDKPYIGVCDKFPNGWFFYQDWISGRESQAGSL